MDNIGGAEIVGLTLVRELNADFYTTNIDEDKIKKMGFSDIKLKSIGEIPINAPFRQQMASIKRDCRKYFQHVSSMQQMQK